MEQQLEILAEAGGGGAGAGIGGKGGAGGSGNKTFDSNRQAYFDEPVTGCGYSGEPGEDCGIVNIYDDIEVNAYGGAGGSGGAAENSGSTGGGGGYPAARNWRTEELAEAGGDHMNGGGGYSGGNCENSPNSGTVNGLSNHYYSDEQVSTNLNALITVMSHWSYGAGYYGVPVSKSTDANGNDYEFEFNIALGRARS